MATAHTPNLNLPYPDEDAPADVPADLSALALAIDALQNLATAGDLKMSAAAAPPAGWLLCDGTAVLRTDYPKLYAAIGVAFGAGDGATTFNLPDYRGRTLVGAGAGPGLTARALGAKGGEELHQLLAAESGVNANGTTGVDAPDHTHAGQTAGATARHTHSSFAAFASSCTAGPAGFYSLSGSQQTGTDTPDHAHNFATGGASARHTHTLAARNADAGHNNMQPYAVANVFIKT